MNIEIIRYRLPVYWACPLIDDDYAGLTDKECDDNNTSPSIDDMEIIKINLCRIIQTRYGITQLWFIPLIERIQNACCKHYNDVDLSWENFIKRMSE